MFGNRFFDNEELRKYTLLFGTLFNNIRLRRENATPADEQEQIVPIAYGGREKYIARNTQDPDIERSVASQLPRMAFELMAIEPDPLRNLNPMNNLPSFSASTPTSRFVPRAWNLKYNLYITARQVLDASKILQQILPYFQPTFGLKAEIIDDGCPIDLIFVLDGVDMQDNYEGSMGERRLLVWTLGFTLKAYFYGPQSPEGAIIRFVTIDTHTDSNPLANSEYVSQNTYPTLANTALEDILPTDPYTIVTDLTEFFLDD